MDGEQGLGVAAVSGAPRARTWDAVASAHAPLLVGETVTFVTLADGTVVVDGDVPDGSLVPLAAAVEATISPPYRAAALRKEQDVWAAVAEEIVVAELPGVEGDVVELVIVEGARELTIDGERTIRPLPALDVLAGQHRDAALHAERVDGQLFAVEVFPL